MWERCRNRPTIQIWLPSILLVSSHQNDIVSKRSRFRRGAWTALRLWISTAKALETMHGRGKIVFWKTTTYITLQYISFYDFSPDTYWTNPVRVWLVTSVSTCFWICLHRCANTRVSLSEIVYLWMNLRVSELYLRVSTRGVVLCILTQVNTSLHLSACAWVVRVYPDLPKYRVCVHFYLSTWFG